MAQTVKNLPPMREIQVQSQSQADSLEKEMATHSSILAWEIPWTVEPGMTVQIRSDQIKSLSHVRLFATP